MTDKQIIIDGVDVSGCEWIREVGLDSEYICTCNSPNKTSGYCKNNPNCLYKNYKRKEQECDMWKNLTVDNGAVALKYQQQLDQLKAENEELKRQYKELGQCSKGLKEYFEKEKETLSNRFLKLEQTLTEIKEIAERSFKHSQCNCGAKADLDLILQKISEVVDEKV